MKGFDHFQGQRENPVGLLFPVIAPHDVNQDAAFGLVIHKGLHLSGQPIRIDLLPLDHQEFVTFQKARFFGHPVGENFPNDRPPPGDFFSVFCGFVWFSHPGALIVREGIHPLIEVERPQGQHQSNHAGPNQPPSDASKGGRHGSLEGTWEEQWKKRGLGGSWWEGAIDWDGPWPRV